jgi:hypothetical protein
MAAISSDFIGILLGDFYDYLLFFARIRILARVNQYFGMKAAVLGRTISLFIIKLHRTVEYS